MAVEPEVPKIVDSPEADRAQAYEDLLDAVWRAEANWRFDNRLQIAPKTAHHVDPHVCVLPDDDDILEWTCGCGQKWGRQRFRDSNDRSIWLPL